MVTGGRVLIVDEVDDTRVTLEYAVTEVMKDGPAAVAVACVHNKKKPKKGVIPDGVLYMAGEDVEDHWNCYPWDAESYGRDITGTRNWRGDASLVKGDCLSKKVDFFCSSRFEQISDDSFAV